MWIVATVWSSLALGQDASGSWITLESPHYRMHAPAEAAPWARHTAERLESVRERVAAEVGSTLDATVDIVIAAPLAMTNGAAIPHTG